MSEMRIGISGWRYAPWRGVFYPKGLPQHRELEFASRQVNSIEINGSFYSLQSPSSYRKWHEATPEGFCFSVKGARYVTHILRLKDVKTPLANFFASGVLYLGEKLGPLLWQLPPSLKYDHDLIEEFLKLLPKDTDAASKLARRHNDKLKTRAVIKARANLPLRHAMEVRHASFECEDFVSLLRKYQVALVVADTAGKWPFMEDPTTGFMYLRLHGDEKLYVSGYTKSALREWARKIRGWSRGKTPAKTKLTAPRPRVLSRGRDIFVYFDNDVKVHAPFDAMNLAHQLGVSHASSPEHPDVFVREEPRERWPVWELRKERKKTARD
ncbi:uncharacterized protein YecE (DUF72 family) [Roseimicrobium gellanilyticum]|uniref:Uncharacterized protein YecE (DUF72 family) n=1 Tax=Roseimicrobium gellanilyticum TaxID=748857 RepID=A0A366HR09_9BACT|nr:uncharacterized protein YecE (DUF72 family) [Roseimicrobium gellanilyticum]